MSEPQWNDSDVARYLRETPGFFDNHPDLLAELRIPDPQRGAAVSLMERQAQLLRERNKALETRLANLIRIGHDNDRLLRNLIDWTRNLVSLRNRETMAVDAARELERIFSIPMAAIRTWPAPAASQVAGDVASEAASDADPNADPDAGPDLMATAIEAARGLHAPLCGAQIDLRRFAWLDERWSAARSAALVPLRAADGADAFGLIVLGAPEPARFDAAMGTAVLALIGELTSAALRPDA